MQADKIWQAALGELQLQVNKANFNTWLKDTRGIDYSNNVFVVAVPTEFIAEWLKSRLNSLVSRTLSTIIGKNVMVQFQVQAVKKDTPRSMCHTMPDGGVSLKSRELNRQSYLNPKFTFDNFVAGDCNRLPYTASIEIADNPGGAFNPLYIYGGTGTGKTHLLHAIGHVARASQQLTLYMSSEQFTNEFIVAVRNKNAEEFRNKFNDVDIFLLDDVQFLSGKTQTQECIFHILNDFLDDNRQVVVTGDRPPKDIESLHIRLRSRLEGGLLADIYPPDHKTRVDILELKSHQMGVGFTPQVLNYMASHLHRNVRELEGALTRLSTFARLNGIEIDLPAAKQVLSDMVSISRQQEAYHCPTEIINTVAEHFDIAPDTITSKKRDLKTSRARHVVMYLLRQQNHCNLAEIGRLLGGRDHTTVIHGYEKITSELNVDSQLSKSIEVIKNSLRLSQKDNNT
ncbi:MAG: chromosomal replication initiator protein DnaA [Dehalococcoidia bacterium]|nr:chromosomal replication initiator protein DnaA [Dehalococcoidia bacterium]MDD5493573.1 chromosomal replication initiator protein DnaA [Dehalococcoidia bacterium]